MKWTVDTVYVNVCYSQADICLFTPFVTPYVCLYVCMERINEGNGKEYKINWLSF